MALFVEDRGSHNDYWAHLTRFPGRSLTAPAFAECHAYKVLRAELGRYLDNEVRGRSFLIAGHRGSGKTSLVLRALDAPQRSTYPTLQQRPLVVKVHGPSLLLPIAEPEGQAPPKKAAANRGEAAEDKDRDKNERTEEKSKNKDDETAQAVLIQITIALYRALWTEVVCCYRQAALQYMARGGPLDLPELAGQLSLELDNAPSPAVLRDFWARIGALQQGILWPAQDGVTGAPFDPRRGKWPAFREIFGSAEADERDQGIREVVALSTAAQAFQVVIGSVKDQKVETDSTTGTTALEGQAKPIIKDVVYPLLGLLTGGLVGGAVLFRGNEGPAVSAAAGLITALATSLTLTWNTTRLRKRSVEQAYTFVRDRRVATLERELPILIQRIRSIGLAPVFVVDELDKVDRLASRMTGLIERLKHLVADYSFFCFLTDRDYLEYVNQCCQSSAYPKEHTYFSHRLYLLYQPDELHQDLEGRNESEGRNKPEGLIRAQPDGKGTKEDIALAEDDKFAFCHLLLHRSMLHMFDLRSELARICDDQGRVCLTSGQLWTSRECIYHIMIELAVESLLRDKDLHDRIDQDPRFGQLVYDVLHHPSRSWLRGDKELKVGDTAVEQYLRGRLQATVLAAWRWEQSKEAESAPPAPSRGTAPAVGNDSKGAAGRNPSKEAPNPPSHPAEEVEDWIRGLISEPDRKYLRELVRQLAELIAKPWTLVQRLQKDLSKAEKGSWLKENEEHLRKLLREIPGGALPEASQKAGAKDEDLLLKAIPGKNGHYRWQYDPFGRALKEEAPGKRVPAKRRKEAEQADTDKREKALQRQEAEEAFLGHIEQFLKGLAGDGLSLGDLTVSGILPRSPDWAMTQEARDRLKTDATTERARTAVEVDQDVLHRYATMLVDHGRLLAHVLVIGRLIGRAVSLGTPQEETARGVRSLAKATVFVPTKAEEEILIQKLAAEYELTGLGDIPAMGTENGKTWADFVQAACDKVRVPPTLMTRCDEAWKAWLARVEKFVETAQGAEQPGSREPVCIATHEAAGLALAKPIAELSIADLSALLRAAAAETTPVPGGGHVPPAIALAALHLLGLRGVIGRWPELQKAWASQTDRPVALVSGEEVSRWSAFGAREGRTSPPTSTIIVSAGENGLTSQWHPSSSYGALVVSREDLEWAWRNEGLLSGFHSGIQEAAHFAVVFIDLGDTPVESIEAALPPIPKPFGELRRLLLGRKLPEGSRQTLVHTDSLDNAMKEALGERNLGLS